MVNKEINFSSALGQKKERSIVSHARNEALKRRQEDDDGDEGDNDEQEEVTRRTTTKATTKQAQQQEEQEAGEDGELKSENMKQ